MVLTCSASIGIFSFNLFNALYVAGNEQFEPEDISTLIQKRAIGDGGGHRYATDVQINIQLLSHEKCLFRNDLKELRFGCMENVRHLLRLWRWIERVESLNYADKDSLTTLDDPMSWPAKSLLNSGVSRLLRLDLPESEDYRSGETTSFSEGCFVGYL